MHTFMRSSRVSWLRQREVVLGDTDPSPCCNTHAAKEKTVRVVYDCYLDTHMNRNIVGQVHQRRIGLPRASQVIFVFDGVTRESDVMHDMH